MLGAYSPDIFRYTETFFHVVFRFAEGPFGSAMTPNGGPKNKEWTKNQRWTKNKEWTKNAEFPLFNHGVAHPDF